MTIDEIRPLLHGFKQVGKGQYKACCPAHDDKNPSLSISETENGHVLLNCFAGCSQEAIANSLGVSAGELKPSLQSKDSRKLSTKRNNQAKKESMKQAEYIYRDFDGNPLMKKIKYTDATSGKKSFEWKHMEDGQWVDKRGGDPVLYNLNLLKTHHEIWITEGEKDADNLIGIGFAAVSAPDGAGRGKWKPQYTEALSGKKVVVMGDNDEIGKAFAIETCNALAGHSESVKLIDLSSIWEMGDKEDISDILIRTSADEVRRGLLQLDADTAEYERQEAPKEPDPFLSCFKTLNDFTEEEAKWLIPGWIPEGQITLLAADGGVGKTTVWCNVITALSNGTSSVLDPPGYQRGPAKVAFLTTEDSVRKKLRRKLREAGANLENIITPDFLADKEGILRGLKFGSAEMERFIRYFKPVLCIFDPVQGFVPPDINMGSRNAMRDCMAPLISLGEECGTTFLVICHTNKRKGASGRERIADSADLWDISRVVMMSGYTENQGIRYLSNEKNNYTRLQETILFSINDRGQIQHEGTTWKRDREYVSEYLQSGTPTKKENCKEYILQTLTEAGGKMSIKELEEQAKKEGYRFQTIRRAKEELKENHNIRLFTTGFGKEKIWHVELETVPLFSDDFEDRELVSPSEI